MMLEYPDQVIHHLRGAIERLSAAHLAAGEIEDGRRDLSGPVRDAIFGLNTATEALTALIEEAHIDGAE